MERAAAAVASVVLTPLLLLLLLRSSCGAAYAGCDVGRIRCLEVVLHRAKS
jgi:hypothetical protein